MPFLDEDGVTRLTTDYLDIFARKEDAVLDPSGGLIRTDEGISIDSLIEDAIGDLTSVVANLVTHDLFYFGYDEVNGKKMISIFKRGDI